MVVWYHNWYFEISAWTYVPVVVKPTLVKFPVETVTAKEKLWIGTLIEEAQLFAALIVLEAKVIVATANSKQPFVGVVALDVLTMSVGTVAVKLDPVPT